jgi:hypothetical protein
MRRPQSTRQTRLPSAVALENLALREQAELTDFEHRATDAALPNRRDGPALAFKLKQQAISRWGVDRAGDAAVEPTLKQVLPFALVVSCPLWQMPEKNP